MPDKLIVRVLAAVEAGLETSAAIAAELGARRKSVSKELGILAGAKTLVREKIPQQHAGRPTFKYRPAPKPPITSAEYTRARRAAATLADADRRLLLRLIYEHEDFQARTAHDARDPHLTSSAA